ncbi:MAG: DNA repair protein RadA [Vallitaleaceae bacterium]|nr:DNA repair protein RadA [Vallitaleaceae bacterium]
MAKAKLVYTCNECGNELAKWVGQCPVCQGWSTYPEEPEPAVKSSRGGFTSVEKQEMVSYRNITTDEKGRITTDIAELDRVLGGGVVEGSLILVGGDPGIGKSTLLLQICQKLANKGKTILYISGEESLHQIKLRGDRLGADLKETMMYTETNVELIQKTVSAKKPDILMIDSIQTMYSDEISSIPGSVSQVRESTAILMKLAKNYNIATFLVGHVTKDGAIAGPRILEHMVDTVLYFEGDKNASYRILRAVKNRFGSTNEMGIFEMGQKGLMEVLNPSEYMLSGRPLNEPGSLVVCGMEGSRPIFVEVQALITGSSFNMPRRTVTGADYNRVMMLMAIIEKKYGISLMDTDCYVNLAGGIRMNEPSLDLGIIMAIISSAKNQAIDPHTVFMGEVGLTGEIRGITFVASRVKEAQKLGFTTIVLPKNNLKGIPKSNGIRLIAIEHIHELKQLFYETNF